MKLGKCGLLAVLGLLLSACGGGASGDGAAGGEPPPPPADPSCASALVPTRFASQAALWQHHVYLDSLHARPTGSPSHAQFVDWLDSHLRAIPGVELRATPYTIDHWLETGASLQAGAADGALATLPVSGAVPYSRAGSASGTLLHVPAGTAIGSVDVRGKIVLRDAATGSIPQAAFAALEWFSYDPDLRITTGIAGNYERDFLGYDQRMTDLREAGAGGAAGMILMHSFPRAQVAQHYAPYEGVRWPVPAVYVGADEAASLLALAQSGGRARIAVAAEEGPRTTRSLVARLQGKSNERIVIESHTDGTNVHEDNGPLVMLEMARYFASFPTECREKTLEFAFNTAHFYQQLLPPMRHGGAGQFAGELDAEYEDGTVAVVLALEHLGTFGYEAVPRADGGPGRELVKTGTTEPQAVFVSASPVLIATTLAAVVTHDMRGTIALRGADLPGQHIPLHYSFGGEGTPYNEYLLPTVATITAPWALYNPAFGLEVLDPELVHRNALMYTDLVHALMPLSRYLLAGEVLADRQARAALCAAGNPGGLASCEGIP